MLTRKFIQCFLVIAFACSQQYAAGQINANHKIGSITGKYHFTTTQTPDQLTEIYPVYTPSTGLTYQWEQSSLPLSGFIAIAGATSSSYTFSGPLSSTMYYRRKTSNIPLSDYPVYSNVLKVSVVSSNWEDINYLRENTVLVTGVSSWSAVEQLPIGDKLQTTTYLDGIGRKLQTISRETATPPTANGLWGDMVQFAQYDAYGRQPLQYLPYITTSQSGKYKVAPLTEQPQYYSTNYNQTSAYASATFDFSPLNRVKNIKKPGTVWAASAGTSAEYELNSATDNVQMWAVDYVQGNVPVHQGVYPANSLYKEVGIDENGKRVIQFIDKSGQLILRKVQLDDNPSTGYPGWICTYNIYDDFGQLRYQIQPEGVNYLAANSWSFAGPNGQLVLNEQTFQYSYDDKGRTTWKKAPGAQPLRMLYDVRDRVVYMQDGNQAALSTPQWTANIYDELDRPIITTLYNTSKSITTLQSDISNAPVSNSITINNAGTVSVTNNTHLNPLSSAELNNSTVTTLLQYSFYDNYGFNGVKTFNTNYTNGSAYSTSDPNVMPIAWTKRVTSMPTGGMSRVLGTTVFLSTTVYYDERGNAIQGLADNIKAGTDIITMQYHFDGRLLSSCTDHTVPNTGYTNYKILSKNLFDKLGRITSIQKQFGSNAFKTIASYSYDDAGRLKEKKLDPDYTSGGNTQLEALAYSYNIHNQLTGINKDYALKTPGSYNKWGHFFGMYLGFDNQDGIFNAANLNGQLTGIVWNTQGDDAQRKFDFSYDNAGRLVNALFKEKKHTGDAWSNSELDFSSTGSIGKITYDLNGNLLNLLQKGVVPGSTAPITVDNLNYSYASLSNKLQTVTDAMTSTTVNGKFGDFKDGTNGSPIADYVYDANGNVVIDLNKNAKELAGVAGANGIKYNFLDKPEEIRIAGKGTIKMVYSAGGQKLQRSFTPEPGSITTTTSYINQFTYQETTGGSLTLQHINFEEGRIRIIEPVSQGNGLDALVIDGNITLPNSKEGVFDYYIFDYQQNVRMILTEEVHTASNTATMETARASLEESIFGQTGTGNEVSTTRFLSSSSNWQNGNIGTYVSRLGASAGPTIGPNTLQRVMAGDKLSATVLYYHQSASGGNSSAMLTNVLGSLVQAISGSGNTSISEHSPAINSNLGGLPGFSAAVQPNGSNPAGTNPQAFLTILFFDERFNFIPAADGGVAQLQVAASVTSSGSSLTLPDIKAPKNGYAYVYVSNQSNNPVYFDNLQVGVVHGNIIEENHYYAYGLKIAAISGKKLGSSYEGQLKNNYLFQGAFSELDDDIGWNDYALRNYDPQIGRWVQQDPYQEFATPYTYVGNDPINVIDPSGGKTLPFFNAATTTLSTTAETAITIGEVVITSTTKIASAGIKGISISTLIIVKVFQTANLLNGAFNTQQTGSLTNQRFESYMNSKGYSRSNMGQMAFNKLKGAALEVAAYDAGGGYSLFRKQVNTGLGYTVIPDARGVIGVTTYTWKNAKGPGLRHLSFKSVYFEAKAIKNSVGLTKQIKGEIAAVSLERSDMFNEEKARDYNGSSLILITWDDVDVKQTVIDEAKDKGVNLYQIKAYFNEESGEITFGELIPRYETSGALRPKGRITGKTVKIDLTRAGVWSLTGSNETGNEDEPEN